MFPHQARVLEGLAARVVAVQEARDGGLVLRELLAVVVVVVVVLETLLGQAAQAS